MNLFFINSKVLIVCAKDLIKIYLQVLFVFVVVVVVVEGVVDVMTVESLVVVVVVKTGVVVNDWAQVNPVNNDKHTQ